MQEYTCALCKKQFTPTHPSDNGLLCDDCMKSVFGDLDEFKYEDYKDEIEQEA